MLSPQTQPNRVQSDTAQHATQVNDAFLLPEIGSIAAPPFQTHELQQQEARLHEMCIAALLPLTW